MNIFSVKNCADKIAKIPPKENAFYKLLENPYLILSAPQITLGQKLENQGRHFCSFEILKFCSEGPPRIEDSRQSATVSDYNCSRQLNYHMATVADKISKEIQKRISKRQEKNIIPYFVSLPSGQGIELESENFLIFSARTNGKINFQVAFRSVPIINENFKEIDYYKESMKVTVFGGIVLLKVLK